MGKKSLLGGGLLFLVAFFLSACSMGPSKAEWDAAQVKPWPEPLPQFSAKIIYNYQPLLRIDRGVSIRALEVDNKHNGAGGLVTTIWARRASESIVIDWDADRVSAGNVDNVKSSDGPSPQYVAPGMDLWGSDSKINMKIDDKIAFELPQQGNGVVFPLAVDPACNFAFGMERPEKNSTAAALVIVDIQAKKLVGNFPLPPCEGLHCIFRPNDYLMLFDFGKQWIMLIDLKDKRAPAAK